MFNHPMTQVLVFFLYALWVVCKYTTISIFHAVRLFFIVIMTIVRALPSAQTPYKYEEPPDDPPYRSTYHPCWDKRHHKDESIKARVTLRA